MTRSQRNSGVRVSGMTERSDLRKMNGNIGISMTAVRSYPLLRLLYGTPWDSGYTWDSGFETEP